MKHFSNAWISSVKPAKQRKYRFNAPLHIKGEFLNAHLSKDLRTKYGRRSLRVRTGDKVRIMRGQFKRQEGKVEEVDVIRSRLFITKVEHTKRDGTKARYPIQPSNVLIVEINTDDKMRMAKLKNEKVVKKASSSSDAPAVPKPVQKAAAPNKANTQQAKTAKPKNQTDEKSS